MVAFDSFQASVVFGIPITGVKRIYEQPLPPVNLAGWQVTVVELTFPPGTDSPKHIHPGFVLAYVLDGDFRFHLEGEQERVLSTGSMFYEAPGAIHLPSGSASATRPARVLALAFGETGKATTEFL
jgi:quercetin dioxygenase-like cupin family protein